MSFEPTYLFGPRDRRPSVFDPTAYVAALVRALGEQGFGSDDVFVMAGGMVQVGLAMMALQVHCDGPFRVMIFSAHEDRYLERTLENGLEVS